MLVRVSGVDVLVLTFSVISVQGVGCRAVPNGTALNLRTTAVQNWHWFRGGLVFKAHILFLSLNSRLESNKEEEEV